MYLLERFLSGKLKQFKVYKSKYISGQVSSKIWLEKYDCLMAPTKQYAFFSVIITCLCLDGFFSDPSVFHFCMQSVIIFTIATCKKRKRWKIWPEIKTSQ